MSKNQVFARLFLGSGGKIQKGLAAGFFSVSSLLSLFTGGQETHIEEHLLREILQVRAAVEEQKGYSPKGLGEHYKINGEFTYVVQGGDNIYMVANAMKKNGIWIKPKQIVEWNNLVAPHYSLKPGMTLVLYDITWEPQLVEASWYGPGFHGNPTKNGEIFNKYALTVASNRIPLGSHIWIFNPETSQSVMARVNDTGSFEKYGRQLDVSQAIATRLGFRKQGVTTLQVCIF